MRIFVDQDGVLSDFKRRFQELYGKEPETDYPKTKNTYYNNFNEIVSNGNFANLDPMPDMDKGLDFLNSIKQSYEIYVLTSTAREEYFERLASEKTRWLLMHNIYFQPIFVPGKRFKKLYARPGDVLIDDTLSNIESWVSVGGIGIYHTSWEDTINKLSPLL